MKHRTCILLYTLILLIGLSTACCDDPHENERGLTVALDNSRCPDEPIGTITLCIYGTDGNLCATYNYADAQDIAAALILLPAGHYTLGVVINATPETDAMQTLTTLHEWVETKAAANRQLLSGIATVNVAAEGITRAYVPLYQPTFPLPTLRLLLTLPTPHLPDHTPAKKKTPATDDTHIIRCVAELVKQGTDHVVLHKPITPQQQTDSTYLVELAAPQGNYDLRLWTDHPRTDTPLADTYYNTENLKTITIAIEPYVANTDAKDAAYHSESDITLPEEGTTINVQLQRPLAKYRILADDVETYRRLAEADPQKYPPLEELTVTVLYEGYFPYSFNAATGKLDDVTKDNISYTSIPMLATGETEEWQITSDWILTGTADSFISAIVSISNAKGEEICRTNKIRIDYRRGHLTTLRGNFLTAGISGGGITFDTDWEDIIIEF